MRCQVPSWLQRVVKTRWPVGKRCPLKHVNETLWLVDALPGAVLVTASGEDALTNGKTMSVETCQRDAVIGRCVARCRPGYSEWWRRVDQWQNDVRWNMSTSRCDWSMRCQVPSWLQRVVKTRWPVGKRCPLKHVNVTLWLSWWNVAVAFSTYGDAQQPSSQHTLQHCDMSQTYRPQGRVQIEYRTAD